MGCVLGKSASMGSPGRANLDVMKREHGYVASRDADERRGPPVAPRPPPLDLGADAAKTRRDHPGRGADKRRPASQGPGGGYQVSEAVLAELRGGGKGSQGDRESKVKEIAPRRTLLPPPVRPVSAGEDEMINGWPRWLVNNVPPEVLAGLVPKSADSYEKLDKVGQGTYSNVYKARDRETGNIFALKKVRFDTSESESVKFMAREIMILQKLNHPNVIKLEGLATSRMHYSLYLVFDFMQSDLARVISRSDVKLTEPQVKCYMKQLLSGLQHCHERGILHRDIKGSNLLIDKNGVLKIADFGLANFFYPNKKRSLTSRVVTLWYRAPELLLGTTDYGVGIDLWSAGCLLAEMFVGKPIMPGRNEVEQLYKIFKLCGSPSDDYWRKFKLATSFQPPPPYKPSFTETFRDFPPSALRLLKVLLALDPSNRGSAASALSSEFFSTSPLACDLSGLPVICKETDESIRPPERKKHSWKGKQLSQRQRDGERKLETANANGVSGSPKVEKPTDLLTDSQDQGSSTGSTSSSMMHQRCTPSPVASL